MVNKTPADTPASKNNIFGSAVVNNQNSPINKNVIKIVNFIIVLIGLMFFSCGQAQKISNEPQAEKAMNSKNIIALLDTIIGD